MATSSLCLHAGARLVSQDELAGVKAPPPAGRWFPLSHAQVLGRVKEALAEAGYMVRKERLALSRGDHRFFATLDLEAPLAAGVTLAVGVRNSTDRSFPLGFCAGARVFVCDNLAFRSELLVRRKHTRFGGQRFAADIAAAVTGLGQFRQLEQERLRRMMHAEVGEEKADSLILRAFERGIISAPLMPAVIREWREPRFEEFRPRTLWSLLNAFTAALAVRASRAPQEFAVQTMRLHAHLEPARTEGLDAACASAV